MRFSVSFPNQSLKHNTNIFHSPPIKSLTALQISCNQQNTSAEKHKPQKSNPPGAFLPLFSPETKGGGVEDTNGIWTKNSRRVLNLIDVSISPNKENKRNVLFPGCRTSRSKEFPKENKWSRVNLGVVMITYSTGGNREERERDLLVY